MLIKNTKNTDADLQLSAIVKRKQLDILYGQLPKILLVSTVIPLCCFLFLQDFPDQTILRIWLASMLFVVVIRGITAHMYSNSDKYSPAREKLWSTLFITGVLLAGLAWGGLGWAVYPLTTDAENRFLIFLILLGVAAGSMTTLAYRMLPSSLFIILTLSSLLIGFYRVPESYPVASGLAIVFNILFLLRSNLAFCKNNTQTIFLQEQSFIREKKMRDNFNLTKSYLTAIDNSTLGVFVVDANFQIHDMNETMINWFGDQRGKICYQSVAGLDQPCAYCRLQDVIVSGKTVQYHPTISDGRSFEIIAGPIANPDGGVFKMELIRDISQQVETREELQKALQVSHQMAEQARKANLAKSRFLANMSHEVRTPMNAIIGRTRLALGSNPDPEMHSHLEAVFNSSQLLMALLNDILDISKIEADELVISKEPYDIYSTIKSSVTMIRQIIEEGGKDLTLTYTIAPGIPRGITGDPLRLKQILLNLLNNAVKFTEQGKICLTVESMETEKEMLLLQFTVTDSGMGIAPDQQQTIFKSFIQIDDSSKRKFGGTGLGLAICRQLCELMGGSIEVISEPGKGSSFIFSLPLQACDVDDLPAITENILMEQPADTSLSLLLVEDNEANQMLATLSLKKMNHTVCGAGDGLQALKLLADQEFDVVIMDCQMPVMDGYTTSNIIRLAERGEAMAGVEKELANRLTSRLQGGHIPIIAMTANAMSGDREKCLAAGMDHYLAKPYDPDSLSAVFYKIKSANQNN